MSRYGFHVGVSLRVGDDPENDPLLETLSTTSIRHVELGWTENFENADWLDRLGETLQGMGVRVNSIHAPFGRECDISQTDESIRAATVETIATVLRTAPKLDAGIVVVHGSAEPISPDEREARFARCRASLDELVDVAAENGVRIAVELLPRTCLGNATAELERLLEGYPTERIGVCIDANHATPPWKSGVRDGTPLQQAIAENLYGPLLSPAAPADAVRALGDRVITLHVSDYDGIDERHWMPFEGCVDWGAFANALADVGYTGAFVYEVGLSNEGGTERLRAIPENFERIIETAGAAV